MIKTTRRSLFAVAAGSIAAGLGLATRKELAAQDPDESHGHHKPIGGPLSSATVSFGQWSTDPPLERSPTSSPGGRNVHLLIPHEVTIQAGGSVNFIIAGFHQIAIYDDGTQMSDINPDLIPPAPALPLINDPNRRIYRGLDPSALSYHNGTTALGVRDRVEVVQFTKRGRYLVICAFRPHFLDDMYGFVQVLP